MEIFFNNIVCILVCMGNITVDFMFHFVDNVYLRYGSMSGELLVPKSNLSHLLSDHIDIYLKTHSSHPRRDHSDVPSHNTSHLHQQ